MRHTLGLRYSLIRLITPPLPAASRPSNTTTTRDPLCWIQLVMAASSAWSPSSSRS